MGFLDKLLGRDKESEDMPAEPQMRDEAPPPEPATMPETPPAPAPPQGMPEPGTEGTPPERETP
jgi:hypothetical protein